MDPLAAAPPFDIPPATVERWTRIDNNAHIQVPIRRSDIDNLFFAVDNLNRGVQNLQRALVDYTNGQLDSANMANRAVTQNLTESANRLRVFMNAIMASAEVVK
jgi:hypothetical protein